MWHMAPDAVSRHARAQQWAWGGPESDLGRRPVQNSWPGAGVQVNTWGLTITRGPRKAR